MRRRQFLPPRVGLCASCGRETPLRVYESWEPRWRSFGRLPGSSIVTTACSACGFKARQQVGRSA